MNEIIQGNYLQEDEHRFLCSVLINGKEEKCYVPASCKLEKLISLSGETVLVKPVKKLNSNLKYSLYAVRKKKGWVLLNLSEANRIIGTNLDKRQFIYLGNRKGQIYEKKIGNYKADIFLPEEKTVLEIKTVITEKKQAVFPSVGSKRTKEQLKAITFLLDNGYKACLMIVALNPAIKRIVIDDSIRELVELAMAKGMLCKGYGIRFDKLEPTLGNEIEIVF